MSVAVGREKCNYYGQYCEAVEYLLPNKFRVQILGMKWNLFDFFFNYQLGQHLKTMLFSILIPFLF